jgi:tRNA threonylcarbamoyladenosine biosynthesis protein TsaE
LVGGPGLVHVDAYRLSSPAEIDDLDLDSSLADSVTLVEWGEGLAEQLSGDRLEVVVERADDPLDDTRRVWLRPVGRRWTEVDWPAWAEATARAEVAQAAAEPTTGGGRDMAESAAGGGRAAAGESEADHG